jgi:2-polyprenyl-3-methyl-5-hydroxy-6-metoxy-1,4-benzoquinol methylase
MLRKASFRTLSVAVLVVLGAIMPAAAQLASRDAQEWIKTLERPERLQAQKVDEVIARLAVKPGQVIADIGAGSGIFSRPLAKAVAPSGKVYAVDIDPALLDHIKQTARQQNLGNIQTVLGEFDDPKIPARDVDLALINDVLHHIEHRAAYLKALTTYIKPGGRIAIIEMNDQDPNTPHKGQPELLVSRKQIEQWMSDVGFKRVQEFPDLFPGTKWFLVYGKK